MNFLNAQSTNWNISIDLPYTRNKPISINGNIPDFCAWSAGSNIIGEAKMPNDLLTNRSKMQIENFLDHLSSIQHDSVFLLCVTYYSVPDAKFLLRSIPSAQNTVVHLIDETYFNHLDASH